MSFEQFKTQVLLLHSEQSTLDALSSGFNDRYTVHCATSGSEALNTLGDTQIDVIVSAQKLPGMSGVEALREAKKRSPDTLGILLAGNDDSGLEALVGAQQLFEVVRGSVTPESLRVMIDNATSQARLVALAESANDTAANPDEPMAEHIVMETSENGSSIITGTTGRMPALNPEKISAAADIGARSVDVLVLTHDEEFLATVKESARGLHNVIYASTVSQADEAIRKHKIGVAVVDAAMVGANVEKLTVHLRSQAKRLVAIVAGRRDDGEMLMDLINRGKVYRFLLKPVSPGRSRLAIEASVKHHLEAPDSAFKVAAAAPAGKPAAASAPAPGPAAKPKPEAKPATQTRPAPQPKAKAIPAAGQQKSKPPAKAPAQKAPKPAAAAEQPAGSSSSIVAKRDEALSPVDQDLGDAFGGEDSSFTETVTGLVDTVARSLKPKKKDKKSKPDAAANTSAMDIPPAPGVADHGSFFSPQRLAIIGVAVVVVAGAGFWLFGGSDEAPVGTREPVADRPATADEAWAADSGTASIFETEVVVPAELGIDDLLDEARLAASAGQIFSPVGSNAIELYLAALDVAPADPLAQQGLDDAIEQALGLAESALLERRADDAAAALEGVQMGSPEHPRLPFLQAQLAQIQLRDYLDGARVAIRESRFEDAQSALDGAARLGIADQAEIDAIAEQLRSALADQRIDDVLAQANERLDDGRLVTPANDNARYYFELALSADPGNTAARQGLAVVASKLVLQARSQIDRGNFDRAESLLADARRLDPASSELAASTSALSEARQRRAQEIEAARNRAAAEQRAAEQRAAAERAAAEAAAAERLAAQQAGEAPAPEQPEPQQQAVVEEPEAESQPVAAAAQQVADEPVADEPASSVGSAEPADSGPDPAPAAAESMAASTPVAVSSLKRTRYVAPRYPRVAQRRALSGWVDVVFTVDIDGTVTDIEARDSDPGDTFVSSAINAVEKWEFEPVIEDGVAIRKRAAVRMMFAIE